MIETRGHLPLTPHQEAVWLGSVLRPTSPPNAGCVLVAMRGPVDVADVRGAYLGALRANQILRATLSQEIPPRFRPESAERMYRERIVDLDCPEGEELQTARRWRAMSGDTWDLCVDPPVRFTVLRHGPGRLTLIVDMHHIAFDGRSKFIFAQQFAELMRGHPVTSPDTLSGAPNTVREDGRAEADALDEVVDYWSGKRELIAAAATRTALGPDVRRSFTVSSTPIFAIREDRHEAMVSLGRRLGVSTFTVILAATARAFAVPGGHPLIIAVPVDVSTEANRHVIGMEVNTVPCVVEVQPEMDLDEAIASAAHAVAHVRRYRRVPYPALVRRLRARHASATDDAMSLIAVSYVRGDFVSPQINGISCEWDFFAPNTTNSFGLTFQFRQLATSSVGRLDFDDGLLSGPLASALMSQVICASGEVDTSPRQGVV